MKSATGTKVGKWVEGPASYQVAGRFISLVGELAGIKVHTHPKTGKVKYASAHDLRRSFGSRWARRIMPAVLQQFMRHESIDTTMSYYVELDARELAEEVWQGRPEGKVFGRSHQNSPETTPEVSDASLYTY